MLLRVVDDSALLVLVSGQHMTDTDADSPLNDDVSSGGDSEPNTIPLKTGANDALSPAIRPYDADLTSEGPTASAPTGEEYSLLNPPEGWQTAGPEWHRVEKIEPARAKISERASKRRMKRAGFLSPMGCNLIVFVASVCVMVLELTASRLIAKHVGSSLYTWTSVIGVVLAGITVGNFVGGWMADRFDREKILGRLFLLASVASLSVLWLDQLAAGRTRPDDLGWPMWVFLTVAEMFFLPALALGTISPVVASIALDRSEYTGSTVGNVYAWGAFGSIIGTFLTGFWLIDVFGTRMIIGGTAGMLALLGVAVSSKQLLFRTAVCCGWLQFLVVTTAAASVTSGMIGEVGEVIGRLKAERDHTIGDLAEWYGADQRNELDKVTRTALIDRTSTEVLEPLDREATEQFRKWLRNGLRHQLDDELRASIEAVVSEQLIDRKTVNQWREHGEEIGYHLHSLGLYCFLRSDQTGEYHDESNYSYVNVSDTLEGDEVVRQLRLDKLVHSYFNPERPSQLYYEYEQIYAEVTERVATSWSRETSISVEPFDGLVDLAARLPDWAKVDLDTGELTIRGVLTLERREQLIKASPYGSFWLAVEELAADTREPLWGGLSSVEVASLPPGADGDEFLQDRLTFEPSFKSLNAFRVLDEDDVTKLCSVGDAGKSITWKTAVDLLMKDSRQVSTFFIGGGGFVFPRWIETEFSDKSRIDVAELDPAVKLAVQKEMGLPPDGQTAVRTLIGDARNVVDDLLKANKVRVASGEKPIHYDFVYGDAFNDFSVPWHLTTLEFNEKVKALLNPDSGVYLVNVIDAWPLTAIGEGQLATDESGDAESEVCGDEEAVGEIFSTGLPGALMLDPGLVLEWQFAPESYGGMEVLPYREGKYRLAVRGVMPVDLRDRLIADASGAGSEKFKDGVLAAFEQSKKTRVGRFLSSCTATLGEVFPNVYVFSTAHGTPSDVRDTFVIVASMSRIDVLRLAADGRHWDTPPFATLHTSSDRSRTTTGQMDAMLETSRGLILTDDYAPVDNLLRPVFDDQD
tara:strand:+ start:22536 stop:25634 length:3099 start_codon:yes stop_codon:yes gene_type:complete